VAAAFEWEERVELSLKGKAEVVVAHRPSRARRPSGRRPSREGTPLVGREPELEALREALAGLLSGRGRVLLVRGAPGLGKTRLLAELRRGIERSRAAGRRPHWLEGRCVSYGERISYFPFQVLLRDWLDVAPEQSEAEAAALLDEHVAELLPDDAVELRPFLHSLLGLAPQREDAGRVAGLQPEDLQLRAFDAFRSLVERLAADEPVVLALDDLHWADTSSVALAEHLLAATQEMPLLLVLAMRPERGHPSSALAEQAMRRGGDWLTAIELTALARDADRSLLAALVGGAVLPADFERQVLERAEGNPLYLEELVRSLVDAGALVPEDGGWRFEREVAVEVPETVEKLILARVDVLSPVGRELLCAASVLGRRFTAPLLEAVAGDASALRELVRAELVHEGRRWPEQEYRFKHHLIQETTYGSLLRRRRAELHRRAAEAIEATYADRIDERLVVLAHHWERAGEPERALEYHLSAGDAARRVPVPAGAAVEHYTAALAAAASLGLGDDDARVRRALLHRGQFLDYAGPRSQSLEDLGRALAGARAAGDRDMEIDALTFSALVRRGGFRQAIAYGEEALELARSAGDPRSVVNALSTLAILEANQLWLDSALERGEEAHAIARAQGDGEMVAKAVDCLKLIALKLGDLETLELRCAELVETHSANNDLFYLSWARLESVFAALGQGRLDVALARAEEACTLNERLGDRSNEALFLDGLVWVHRARGDYARALELGRRALVLANEYSYGEWQGWSAATLGAVLLDLGAAEEAARVLTAGMEDARYHEAEGEVLRCAGELAWASWLRDEQTPALGLAGEAERMLSEITTPPGSAWLFGADVPLAVARTWLASGDPARAAALAHPLLAAAERSGWQSVVAAAAAVAGRCEHELGHHERAVGLLERALAAAAAGGGPAPAWEAHLSLARIRNGGAAEQHALEARTLLERVLAGLADDPAAAPLAATLLAAAAG
jgi:predicted ATPase